MENLTYGREVDLLFDLKGKLEGRFKHVTTGSEVMWDRNFVELNRGMPLPVQESANLPIYFTNVI